MPDDHTALDQQKAINTRQRLRVKELEAENTRHLADLHQVRSERDSFRNEAAKLRKDLVKLNKELADCRNKYDALHSTHEDVKRSSAGQDAAIKASKKTPVSKKRKIEVRKFPVAWFDLT
jgi:predicted nuclease with TOPRIM domain